MKGTVPIPGARAVAHLEENAGALGWNSRPARSSNWIEPPTASRDSK